MPAHQEANRALATLDPGRKPGGQPPRDEELREIFAEFWQIAPFRYAGSIEGRIAAVIKAREKAARVKALEECLTLAMLGHGYQARMVADNIRALIAKEKA